MTVSHGVEGQLISEAMICIYSDIKALISKLKPDLCYRVKRRSSKLQLLHRRQARHGGTGRTCPPKIRQAATKERQAPLIFLLFS